MRYTIERSNGEKRTANSINGALRIARNMIGVSRMYRGALYTTDRSGANDRIECYALDIWTTGEQAIRENGSQAPVVISWDL